MDAHGWPARAARVSLAGNVARLCELINNVRTPDDPHFTTFLTAVGMTKTGHRARFFSYMKRRADRPWQDPQGILG